MCLVYFTANLSVNMLSEIDHKAITSNPETEASSEAHLTLATVHTKVIRNFRMELGGSYPT